MLNWRSMAVLFVMILLLLGGGVAKAEQRAAADPPAKADPPITFHASITTRWQIQLAGAFDPSIRADVYDLDPFTTAAADVAAITRAGRRAVCHLDVGASDLELPDAGAFPSRVLGTADGTGRRWLDIRDWAAIRPVLANRLDLCRTKGFQAVDADAADGYAAHTGFGLTLADQVTFDRDVVALAHGYGLAAGVRATPALAATLAPIVDFTVVDGCFAAPHCSAYTAFVTHRKAVYDVETGTPPSTFCAMATAYGYSAIAKSDARLTAPVHSC